MMGAAMLKRHRFAQSLWGWPKCVRGRVRRSPCDSKNLHQMYTKWLKDNNMDL